MNDTSDRLKEKDESFRRKMQGYAEQDNPAAKEWVKHDNTARSAEEDVRNLQTKLDHAPSQLQQAEQELQGLRDQREDHLSSGAPNVFQREKRAEWMSKRDELNRQVEQGQERLAELAQASSPDEIQALQDQIRQRMQDQEQAVVQRREIQLLPSERAQARQGERGREGQDEQEPERLPERLNQTENDWAPSRPAIRTSHGRETYAATAMDEHEREQQNRRNMDEWQQANLGKNLPTQGELDDWIAERRRSQGQSR